MNVFECGYCPNIADCSAPAESLAPNIAAEDMCLWALVASQQRRGLPKASSLIEQGYLTGKSVYIDQANSIVDDVEQKGELQMYKALIYDAYMPLFRARTEKREPTLDEVRTAFNTLHGYLPEYRAMLEMTDSDIRHFWGKSVDKTAVNNTRRFVKGPAGEATVLYLSLYNALEEKGEVLYPSSYREDNPHSEEAQALFGRDKHDCHTNNPSDPSDRKMISIKTTKKPVTGNGETVARINLLQIATEVYHDSTRVLSKIGLDVPDHLSSDPLKLYNILELLMQTDRTDSPFNDFSTVYRDRLSTRIQDVLTNN